MTKTQEILVRAADIIEDYGWTRGAFARDPNGDKVPETSPDACRFCALGAIRRATFDVLDGSDHQEAERAANALNETICGAFDVADWNDNYADGGEHVAASLRKAAELNY